MKKLICLLIAALLAAAACCAFAETEIISLTEIKNHTVEITLELDNEAVLETVEDTAGDIYCARVTCQNAAPVYISIAEDDLVEGLSLSDYSAEDLAALEAFLSEDADDVKFREEKTPSGNLFLARWDESDPVYSIMTIYDGAYIELVQCHDDFSPITQEDTDFAKQVLYGIWTAPVAAVTGDADLAALEETAQ